jgi:hypothetical protein
VELRVKGLVRQRLADRSLGDAEIDHLGYRHTVVQRYEDVRGLDVTVNDALLMRMLDGLADLDEQVEPFLSGKVGLVAVFGELDAPDQFHDEERTARLGAAGIEHLGYVGMIHHGQGLSFRLEPRNDLLGVHSQLDDLERHAPPHRLSLFCDIHHTATALAHLLKHFVAAYGFADGFILNVGQIEVDGRPGGWRVRCGTRGVRTDTRCTARGAARPSRGRVR